MKYTVNTQFLLWFALVLVACDFCYIALHPAYRNYKKNAADLHERLDRWENTFKRDYINSINNVAVALTNRVSCVSSPNAPQNAKDSPLSKPLDIQLDGYSYFCANGVSGFSLQGRLVFRVGDSFLGRRILSADRFGAVLSDGGVIRSTLNPSTLAVTKEKNKNGSSH